MSQQFKHILTAGIAAAAILSGIAGAQAGAFAIREQSAEDLGDAFAGAATSGSSLSSMFWNPATMTSHKGWQSTSAFSAILPYASITATSPSPFSANASSGNIGEAALVPASSMSYQVNDSLWAGLSINSPFGLSTKADHTWKGSFYGQSSDARSIDIRPTLAYKINEMLSFGIGLDIQRFSLHLTSQDPAAPALLDDLKGSSWGVGVTAGVTIKPVAGTEIGIGYRSAVHQAVKGSLSAPVLFGSTVPRSVTSSLTLPDQLNIGLRQKISDNFTGTAGFEWTHWSMFNSFPVYLTGTSVAVNKLAFKYRNGWMASLGGEYKYSPNLTVRGGLAYEFSPVSDAVRGVRLPDSNRIWTTVGLSYAIDKKLSFDASYAHIFPSGKKILINSSHPAWNPLVPVPLAASYSSHIDIVSVGLNYRWDDPKEMEAVPAQKAIVRKY